MKLYNTLTRQKEEFTAPDGKVKMYVCGITPYSASHIGHAMFSVVFDVVRRYLEHKGYEIQHIQNFTDIDDKMIAAAKARGITVEELAEENIQQYLEETDELNIRRAHEYPRATREIPRIVSMIKGLVDEGYAYPANGDVYFRVNRDEDYGKLSRRNADDLLAGARVEIGELKEDPRDFVLWKAQKPGEPAWDSPWGPGRPGWHIECSAMSMGYLGETLDIHGGGQDLIFPHHENEIAQSESYTSSQPFARFWMHNGLLNIGDDKMSKSTGNVISVREALDEFSPAALRLFFLSSHYRNPLVYSEQNIAAQERAIERLRYAAGEDGESAQGEPLDAASYTDRFTEAMDDDLNTPRALAVMFDLSRDINRGKEEGKDVSPARKALREMAEILGIDLSVANAKSSGDAAPFVDLLVDVRTRLRAAKQFEMADQIRDKLSELGVTLEDSASGTGWKLG
ncbi:MAG: cysteine--tRNA ligase [Chloroflexi bacterium]|nr:cysteine--tRNA ligase [Chloroflexota bacterium]MCI0812363.1 cysteine--tRNA ligase [Chloroflexota bacterium]